MLYFTQAVVTDEAGIFKKSDDRRFPVKTTCCRIPSIICRLKMII